jgi:hypothetical protein
MANLESLIDYGCLDRLRRTLAFSMAASASLDLFSARRCYGSLSAGDTLAAHLLSVEAFLIVHVIPFFITSRSSRVIALGGTAILGMNGWP